MDWDHPSVLITRAKTCIRLADRSDNPIEATKPRQLAQEYDAKARGMQSPAAVPDEEPTAQERALAIPARVRTGSKGLAWSSGHPIRRKIWNGH
jgi:hypothetical protein